MAGRPFLLTFETLARSSRPEADDLLVAAIETRRPEFCEPAADAIFRRGSVRGLVAVIRKFDELTDELRRRLDTKTEPLHRALAQCLRHGDRSTVLMALSLVQWGSRIDQIDLIVPLLRSDDPEVYGLAESLIPSLSDRLYDLLYGESVSPVGREELQRCRQRTLEALSLEVNRFGTLPNPLVVIEPLLTLGNPRDAAVTAVLRHPMHECRHLAGDLLTQSRHPGVLRLLFEHLGEPYPPPRVFQAFHVREDLEFVAALLRWFPAELTPIQQANLRQIGNVPWLQSPERLAELPCSLHGRIPAFLAAIALPETQKLVLQEWLVRHGSASGRRGAAEILDRLDFETTHSILMEGLESPDEDISAWATGEIRPRHIPDAFRLLIARLESSSPKVRAAAREQLTGFTLEHVIGLQHRLPQEMGRRAAALAKRIDLNWRQKLVAAITNPIRRTQLTAIEATAKLGLAAEVQETLLSLLGEEDPLIRRMVVEALADCPSEERDVELRKLLNDPSPAVRRSATAALAQSGPVASSTVLHEGHTTSHV